MTLIEREVSAVSNLDRGKAMRILAKSIFKELRAYGYEPRQIVSLSTELISLVTHEMKEEHQK